MLKHILRVSAMLACLASVGIGYSAQAATLCDGKAATMRVTGAVRQGTPGNEVVNGNIGLDSVNCGQGDDRLYGGQDDDKLYGDKGGSDHCYGGLLETDTIDATCERTVQLCGVSVLGTVTCVLD
jgi:hypothetical protein